MRVKINIEELRKTVSDMDMIMKGNTLRLLDSLLVTAGNNIITATANNLNIMVSKRVPGEVLNDGKALLHRDDLAMLLKMKNDVELEFSGNQCVVKGSRLFRFPVDDEADNFPSLPAVNEDEPNFTIPENELLYCLKLKKITSDSGSERARSVWIDKNNILACDGCRLGKIETKYHAASKFMLTDYALNYLVKALDKKSDFPVSFYLSEKGCVKARSASFEITYRQYNCDFTPNYSMFDLSKAKTAVIRKQDLTNTIGFMCDVYKSNYKGKRRPVEAVVYTFCADKLKLAFTTDCKYIEEELPVGNLDADADVQIALPPLLTYELLSMIDGDEINMSFEKPLSPSIIYGQKENEKYLLLSLPVKNAA